MVPSDSVGRSAKSPPEGESLRFGIGVPDSPKVPIDRRIRWEKQADESPRCQKKARREDEFSPQMGESLSWPLLDTKGGTSALMLLRLHAIRTFPLLPPGAILGKLLATINGHYSNLR